MNKTMTMMMMILKTLHCAKHTMAVTAVGAQVEFQQHKTKYGKS